MSTEGLGLSAGRLFRNTVARTVGSVFALLAGAGTGLIVARHLGPRDYGSFAFVWAIAWAVATLVPLGLESLVVRELNREPRIVDLRRVMPVTITAGVLAGSAMFVAGVLFTSDRDLALAMGAAALYVAVSGPWAVVRAVFDAEERMELSSTAVVLESVGALGVVVVLVLDGAGLVAISFGMAAARIVGLGLATWMLRRWTEPAPPATEPWIMPRLLRASLPMAGSRAANELLRRLGILVLGLLVAPEEVGWFVAAATVALYAPVVLLELNRALYPVLSRADSHADRDLLRLFGFTWRTHLLFGTVTAAGLAVLAGPIVTLLYGEAYARAGPLLALLAATIPLRVVSALCAVTLDATYRQTRHLQAAGLAVLVNLTLNVVLIPAVGVWGAAIAAVATEAAFLVACLRALRPHRPRLVVPVLRSLVVAAPVALAAALTPGHVLIRLVAGLVAFAVVVAVHLWRHSRTLPGETDLGVVLRDLALDREESTP